jgi:hypothetical protein
MNEEGNKRLQVTRRQLLAAGGVVAGAAAVGVSGSYILGDGFEEHVADVLGIELDLARELLDGMRETTGGLDFEARATAFVGATTFPGSEILPQGVRERAVRRLVLEMIEEPSQNIGYLGLVPPDQIGIGAPCSGLVHR